MRWKPGPAGVGSHMPMEFLSSLLDPMTPSVHKLVRLQVIFWDLWTFPPVEPLFRLAETVKYESEKSPCYVRFLDYLAINQIRRSLGHA